MKRAALWRLDQLAGYSHDMDAPKALSRKNVTIRTATWRKTQNLSINGSEPLPPDAHAAVRVSHRTRRPGRRRRSTSSADPSGTLLLGHPSLDIDLAVEADAPSLALALGQQLGAPVTTHHDVRHRNPPRQRLAHRPRHRPHRDLPPARRPAARDAGDDQRRPAAPRLHHQRDGDVA